MSKLTILATACAAAILTLTLPAHALGSFYKHTTDVAHVPPSHVKMHLMEALADAPTDLQTSRIAGMSILQVGEALEASYNALPKTYYRKDTDEEDHLSPSAARYLVHTFFRKTFGWVVQGLEPGAAVQRVGSKKKLRGSAIPDNWNAIPTYLMDTLHQKLQRFAFSGVVTVTGVLANLIVNEGVERLADAYELNNFTVMTDLTEKELDQVLDSYMILLSVQHGNAALDKAQHDADRSHIHEMWAGFPQMQVFSHDTLRNFAFAVSSSKNPFVEPRYAFEDAREVMVRLGRKYGKTRDVECQELREGLVEMDPWASGRVQLSQFYAKRAIGPWSLTESKEYLRRVGALDESVPEQGPQVIISNYMNAASNCDSPSDFYSICCISECDDLLNQLEAQIQEPTASPQRILHAVSRMSSGTIEAPRNLSTELVTVLEQSAALNKGNVTLHSRLFAQWLHYAFPHECPYPYMHGRVQALSPVEWAKSHSGFSLNATEEEINDIINSQQEHQEHQEQGINVHGTSMSMWTFEDEMVTLDPMLNRASTDGLLQTLRTVMQLMAFVCGPVAFIVAILWSNRHQLGAIVGFGIGNTGKFDMGDVVDKAGGPGKCS